MRLEVDNWTLRCLCSHYRIWEKIDAGILEPIWKRQSAIRPDGSSTFEFYYAYRGSKELVVRLQWAEDSEGNILGSGMKDPKNLYLKEHHGDYHAHPGDTEHERRKREPELRFNSVRSRKVYGFWRRCVKCPLVGPIEAYRLRFSLWLRQTLFLKIA